MILNIFQMLQPYFGIETRHTKSILVVYISLKILVLSDGIITVALNLKNNQYKITYYLVEEYIRSTLPHFAPQS